MVVFNNLNPVLRKYHLVLLATWGFRLQGSELLPPAIESSAFC